jgi:hypothetical protein
MIDEQQDDAEQLLIEEANAYVLKAEECAKEDIQRNNKGQNNFVILIDTRFERKCIKVTVSYNS